MCNAKVSESKRKRKRKGKELQKCSEWLIAKKLKKKKKFKFHLNRAIANFVPYLREIYLSGKT